MLINGIQAAALEHEGMKTATWSGFNSEYDLIKEIGRASCRERVCLLV